MRKIFLSYNDYKKNSNKIYNTSDKAFEEIKMGKYIGCEVVEVYDVYNMSQMYGYTAVDHSNCSYDVVD